MEYLLFVLTIATTLALVIGLRIWAKSHYFSFEDMADANGYPIRVYLPGHWRRKVWRSKFRNPEEEPQRILYGLRLNHFVVQISEIKQSGRVKFRTVLIIKGLPALRAYLAKRS